jgi:hypothetical protein
MSLTPQQRLDDARDKLHLLQTGRLSVEVEVDGRKVRYARTDVDELRGYIGELEAEAANRKPRFGAIGFIF